MLPRRLSNYCRRGFTLIEIMVAMTIFAILMSSLYASLRMGMKTYAMGTAHAEEQQAGRYAVNQIAGDMRNIYYKPESQYNVTRRQREALLDQQNDQLQQAGGTDMTGSSRRNSTSSRRNSAGANSSSASGLGGADMGDDQVDENLPEMGPPIDLSFKGEDDGDTDRLSLVRRESDLDGKEHTMWGLERVTYYVANGNLYRAVDDITLPDTDEDGNDIPKPYPPRVDKLASNCVGFDLKYGYYHDKEYSLADSWDSRANQYRNPPTDDESDGSVSDPTSGNMANVSGTAASAVLSQQLQQQQQQDAEDDLPGWVELTFKFAPDPKHEERQRVYKQTMLLYNKYSVETYVPPDDDDTDMDSRRQTSREARNGNDSSASGSSGRSSRSSRSSRRSSRSSDSSGSGDSGMGSGGI